MKPHASIFWIGAASEDTIDLQMQQLAEQLFKATQFPGLVKRTTLGAARSKKKVQEKHDEVVDSNNIHAKTSLGIEYVHRWMIAPGHEDWLLILDNLDDIEVNVRRFLPVGAAGSVIITSRDRRVVGSIASSGIHLTAMDLPDAERLFLRLQDPRGRFRDDPQSHPEYAVIQRIVQEMDGFPLAIDQAAAFIRENAPMTFEEYLAFLKPRSEDRELLMRFKEANPKYPESVMTTWEISLRHLERTHARASKILQILGFLDHSRIAEWLLRDVTKAVTWKFAATTQERRLPSKLQEELAYLRDDVGFRTAIGALTSLSLVKRDFDHTLGPVLSLHPLVHEWTRTRLKTDPAGQARLSVAATLILYQSFPFELITKLYNEPFDALSELYIRFDRVLLQLNSVMENLREYHAHTDSIPLECFILCGTLLLYEKHWIYGRTVDDSVMNEIGQTMRKIIPRMQQRLKPIVSAIQKALTYLQSPTSNLLKTAKLGDFLKSLSIKDGLEDSDITLLTLLVKVITDVSENLDRSQQQSINSLLKTDDRLDQQSEFRVASNGGLYRRKDPDVQRRESKIQLFTQLRRFLGSAPQHSGCSHLIAAYVDFHLAGLMTPEEYQVQTELDVVQHLTSTTLSYLDYQKRCNYICLSAKLLLEHGGTKDFNGVQRVFSFAMNKCLANLKSCQMAAKRQQDKQSMARWSTTSYISSSFGRTSSGESVSKKGADLISDLDYIWMSTLPVARAIANPDLYWKVPGNNSKEHRRLDSSQRRYAPKLIYQARQVHDRVKAQLSHNQIAALEFEHFGEIEVKVALIDIYTSLKEWPAVSGLIRELLKCEEIVRYFRHVDRKPWQPWKSTLGTGRELQATVTPHNDSKANKAASRAGLFPFWSRSQKQGTYGDAICKSSKNAQALQDLWRLHRPEKAQYLQQRNHLHQRRLRPKNSWSPNSYPDFTKQWLS